MSALVPPVEVPGAEPLPMRQVVRTWWPLAASWMLMAAEGPVISAVVARLAQPRFYHNDPAEMRASFETVHRAGCRFLVAGRRVGDRFLTVENVDLPDEYRQMFEQIAGKDFRVDVSSTAIRQQGN